MNIADFSHLAGFSAASRPAFPVVQRLGMAAFLAFAVGVLPQRALAVELTGGVVGRFVNKTGVDRDKMLAFFKDETGVEAPLPDPTAGQSFVTIRFLAQEDSAETTVGPTMLIRSRWQEEIPGEYYVYRDRDLAAAGIQKIEFYTSPIGGGLMIKARGVGYGVGAVAGPVDWVEVSMTIGSETFCGRFSDEASWEKRNSSTDVHFVDGSSACADSPDSTTTSTTTTTTMEGNPATIRVPAEWEEQEAVWLQWPGQYEKIYEPAFAQMVGIIAGYQKLHILYDSASIRTQARTAIVAAGGDPDDANIHWHSIANDNAWMRDNGPTYVVQDGELRIQDWTFDAWGGGFGNNIPFAADDAVPAAVGPLVGMPVDRVAIVHERGNLEFNGVDTVILNWSVIGDPERNPGYTKAKAIADMKKYFGVTKVVLIEGYIPTDRTRGHVDGIARFINPTTVVVGQCTTASVCQPGDQEAAVFDDAAADIAAAGFTVIRDPFQGKARYNGGPFFDIDYMNWLVGNGFVIAVGFENAQTNAAAKARLESYYPGRTVYIVDMLASWDSGGGAHCHTNDQPAASTAGGYTPWLP